MAYNTSEWWIRQDTFDLVNREMASGSLAHLAANEITHIPYLFILTKRLGLQFEDSKYVCDAVNAVVCATCIDWKNGKRSWSEEPVIKYGAPNFFFEIKKFMRSKDLRSKEFATYKSGRRRKIMLMLLDYIENTEAL